MREAMVQRLEEDFWERKTAVIIIIKKGTINDQKHLLKKFKLQMV